MTIIGRLKHPETMQRKARSRKQPETQSDLMQHDPGSAFDRTPYSALHPSAPTTIRRSTPRLRRKSKALPTCWAYRTKCVSLRNMCSLLSIEPKREWVFAVKLFPNGPIAPFRPPVVVLPGCRIDVVEQVDVGVPRHGRQLLLGGPRVPGVRMAPPEHRLHALDRRQPPVVAQDGVSVNIIFTISTNAFSPIAPTRIRRIRQRGCAAFGA